MKTLIIILVIIGINIGQSENCTAQKKSSTINVRIAIYYPFLKSGDQLVLWYSKHHTLSQNFFRDYDTIKLPITKNGWYIFRFKVENRTDILVRREYSDTTDMSKRRPSNHNLLTGYYSNPGDDVKVTVSERKPFEIDDTKNLSYKFSGIGSLKYIVKSKMDSAGFACPDTTSMLTLDHQFNPRNNIRMRLISELEALNKFGAQLMSGERYRLMAQLISNEGYMEARVLRSDIDWEIKRNNQKVIDQIINRYVKIPITSRFNVPNHALIKTTEYYNYLLEKATLEFCTNRLCNFDSLYYFIKFKNTGETRSRLLTFFIDKNSSRLKEFDKLYNDAMTYVKGPDELAILKNFRNRLHDAKAFDFALPDINGNIVHLADFKGRTVFIDFWFTGCANCAHFYKDKLESVEEKFRDDKKIVFVTISIDKNKGMWNNSVRSNEYTSQQAINLYTNGEGTANELIKFYDIHEYPQTIIITKEQKVYGLNEAELRKNDNLINTLMKLR